MGLRGHAPRTNAPLGARRATRALALPRRMTQARNRASAGAHAARAGTIPCAGRTACPPTPAAPRAA
eukprot:4019796-Prymnesium_polylepis.1